MHVFLAIVYISFVVAPRCSSLPMKGDNNNINTMMNIARITLVHINKLKTRLPVPSLTELSTRTPSIEGLASISQNLGLLENELQSPFSDILIQIQADVSRLEGRVRSYAQVMNCSVPAHPARESSNSKSFPDSHLYLTMMKVQQYLDKILLNRNKLKVC